MYKKYATKKKTDDLKKSDGSLPYDPFREKASPKSSHPYSLHEDVGKSPPPPPLMNGQNGHGHYKEEESIVCGNGKVHDKSSESVAYDTINPAHRMPKSHSTGDLKSMDSCLQPSVSGDLTASVSSLSSRSLLGRHQSSDIEQNLLIIGEGKEEEEEEEEPISLELQQEIDRLTRIDRTVSLLSHLAACGFCIFQVVQWLTNNPSDFFARDASELANAEIKLVRELTNQSFRAALVGLVCPSLIHPAAVKLANWWYGVSWDHVNTERHNYKEDLERNNTRSRRTIVMPLTLLLCTPLAASILCIVNVQDNFSPINGPAPEDVGDLPTHRILSEWPTISMVNLGLPGGLFWSSVIISYTLLMSFQAMMRLVSSGQRMLSEKFLETMEVAVSFGFISILILFPLLIGLYLFLTTGGGTLLTYAATLYTLNGDEDVFFENKWDAIQQFSSDEICFDPDLIEGMTVSPPIAANISVICPSNFTITETPRFPRAYCLPSVIGADLVSGPSISWEAEGSLGNLTHTFGFSEVSIIEICITYAELSVLELFVAYPFVSTTFCITAFILLSGFFPVSAEHPFFQAVKTMYNSLERDIYRLKSAVFCGIFLIMAFFTDILTTANDAASRAEVFWGGLSAFVWFGEKNNEYIALFAFLVAVTWLLFDTFLVARTYYHALPYIKGGLSSCGLIAGSCWSSTTESAGLCCDSVASGWGDLTTCCATWWQRPFQVAADDMEGYDSTRGSAGMSLKGQGDEDIIRGGDSHYL